jgi:hypothetical protein
MIWRNQINFLRKILWQATLMVAKIKVVCKSWALIVERVEKLAVVLFFSHCFGKRKGCLAKGAYFRCLAESTPARLCPAVRHNPNRWALSHRQLTG